METVERKATGADVYRALNNFVERIIYGRRGELAPVVLPATGPQSYCAFLRDVPERADGQQMHSGAYTATEVAGMVVSLAKTEGAVFSGDGHGLGVRLQHTISPGLVALLAQLNQCVESVVEIESAAPQLVKEFGGAGSLAVALSSTAVVA